MTEAEERAAFEAWERDYLPPNGWRPAEVMFDAWKARAALSAPPGWQPIETAPKDMLQHLFLVNGVAVEAFVDAINQLIVVNERREWRAMRGKPTHWMPLPAAPSSQEQTNG